MEFGFFYLFQILNSVIFRCNLIKINPMKKIIYILLIIVFAFFALALIPINTSKENSIVISGTVKSLSEAGIKDLVFELENDKTTYYINRALENGFQLEKSKTEFIGKKVTLNYAKGWTPLAPFGTTCKHITQISVDGKEVYTEFK
ncbi:hypothetical protein LG45_02380 [Flavobacterium aquatile LMG 4008 = ATCC 11947]|uniref:Uncharacterized protein n=2 Tax=Flavobacterium aquatile TaxID=245 RepID=A0A095SYL6_9FLAO|nr:hypothetical protein LG45_02380 [Flavobacterium aquatile LMG 4008 = ATCC 11947]